MKGMCCGGGGGGGDWGITYFQSGWATGCGHQLIPLFSFNNQGEWTGLGAVG